MTRRAIFILSLSSLAVIVGGFFIGRINYSIASDNVLIRHDGNIASSSDWFYQNCDQGAPGGDNYIVMIRSTSTLVSPSINLDGYASKKLDFKARTYGGVSGSSSQISVSLSLDGGISWLLLAAISPADSTMRDQPQSDLSAYSSNVKIKFETLSATSSKGVGVDEIRLTATLPNQPPQAIAFSSAASAETDEEIIFDGRDSSDNGQIIDWYWDFGDGHTAFASTTSHSYDASGDYNVYLAVIDDLGLSVTSSPLAITIFDRPEATTTATTTPTSTPPEINVGDLWINEVYPAPLSGEDEWVEIYNPTTSTFDLSGLYLLNIDAGKFVTTTLSGSIAPGEYVVIDDIVGNLNNSGDTVVLRSIYPAEGLGVLRNISETAYGEFSDSAKGYGWARAADGSFSQTVTPTRGAANIITAPPVKTAGSSGGGGGSYTSASQMPDSTSTATSTAGLRDYSGLIAINEIYPNPSESEDGDDEFVELVNLSTSTIDLTGFVLSDASKNKHVIKASSTATSSNLIQPGGYFVLYRGATDIALNNTGVETVNIFAPDLRLIDQVEYLGENVKGVSYSRTDDNKWRWVKTPTPGSANAEDELYPDNENPALLDDSASAVKLVGVAKAAKSAKGYQAATLEELNNFSSGDQVRVSGVVSVLPGVLGSQFFYLAGSGTQIYCSKKDFPALQVGDYIEVSGVLSDFSTVGRRIKISGRDQIRFIEHREAPAPHAIGGADVGEDYDSWLVSVTGTVLEIKNRNIMIDDGSGEMKIYINNQIDLKDVGAKPGDKISVSGIVNKTASGYRISPRDLADIRIEKGEVQGVFATSAPGQTNWPAWYLGALVIFLCGIVGVMWGKLRKNE